MVWYRNRIEIEIQPHHIDSNRSNRNQREGSASDGVPRQWLSQQKTVYAQSLIFFAKSVRWIQYRRAGPWHVTLQDGVRGSESNRRRDVHPILRLSCVIQLPPLEVRLRTQTRGWVCFRSRCEGAMARCFPDWPGFHPGQDKHVAIGPNATTQPFNTQGPDSVWNVLNESITIEQLLEGLEWQNLLCVDNDTALWNPLWQFPHEQVTRITLAWINYKPCSEAKQ